MKKMSIHELHLAERDGRMKALGLKMVEVPRKDDPRLDEILANIRASSSSIENAILMTVGAITAHFADQKPHVPAPTPSRKWVFDIERTGEGYMKRIVAKPE